MRRFNRKSFVFFFSWKSTTYNTKLKLEKGTKKLGPKAAGQSEVSARCPPWLSTAASFYREQPLVGKVLSICGDGSLHGSQGAARHVLSCQRQI